MLCTSGFPASVQAEEAGLTDEAAAADAGTDTREADNLLQDTQENGGSDTEPAADVKIRVQTALLQCKGRNRQRRF